MSKRFYLPQAAFLYPALGYRPLMSEIALTSLAINILGLALSLVTLQVYDRILVYKNISTLNLLCLGAAIAILAEASLKICRSYTMGWASAVFEHTVSCNAVRHTLAQEVTHVESSGIGEYLQRIGAISKIRDFYSGQALATLIDLPFVAVFLGLIGLLGGWLVLAPIVLLSVMILLALNLGVRLKHALKKRDKADDTRYDYIIQTLNGIHTLKSLGLEALFERQYEKWQAHSSRANYDVASLSAKAYDQGIIFSHIMMIVVAVTGSVFMLEGQMTLGALVACVMLSGRVMQPVQRALGFWTRLQDVELAHGKIGRHFSGKLLGETSFSENSEKEGRVDIQKVSFSYNSQDILLDNVDLQLKPGETISITGEHGAGKQTLLKLIAGIHPPTQGTVKVNNIEPHLYPSEILVEHVGFLPPVGTIFRGSIYDNLSRFGRVPEARVREIADLLGLDTEIAVLPAGYETYLEGGNADAISPGLRQRIAIARVLATKPRILLFYNADRALDKDGYNRVYRLLAKLKGRVTLLLVTNDQNLQHLADKHYILNNGQLTQQVQSDLSSVYGTMPYQELRL